MRFRHRMARRPECWRGGCQKILYSGTNPSYGQMRSRKRNERRNKARIGTRSTGGNLKQVPGRLDHTARPVLEHSRWILICIVAVDRLPKPYAEWVIEYDVNGCFLRGYTYEAKTSKINLKSRSSSKYGAKESEHRY